MCLEKGFLRACAMLIDKKYIFFLLFSLIGIRRCSKKKVLPNPFTPEDITLIQEDRRFREIRRTIQIQLVRKKITSPRKISRDRTTYVPFSEEEIVAIQTHPGLNETRSLLKNCIKQARLEKEQERNKRILQTLQKKKKAVSRQQQRTREPDRLPFSSVEQALKRSGGFTGLHQKVVAPPSYPQPSSQ